MKNIRNFSVIAHIDHGKSTLSDRLIEYCGGLTAREMSEQILDSMDIERERGITIKAQAVTLEYKKDDVSYQLNFIDTPGHVDFSYEVSRSLSACEGALLVVDGSQGVEAQTLANCYTAVDQGLEVVPVINKIDLPQAEPERVKKEIEDMIGINAETAPLVSAKTGLGIEELLDELVSNIPPPEGSPTEPLQALIVDSWFDSYLGVVSLIRIKNGTIKTGQKFKIHSTGQSHNVDEIGIFSPKKIKKQTLSAGEVGYLVAGIKNIKGAYVRNAYLRGLAIEDKGIINPYKFGLIGSSDSHVGGGSYNEETFFSKIGSLDGTPKLRGSVPFNKTYGFIMSKINQNSMKYVDSNYYLNVGDRLIYFGASGLAGVWAEENTRESIFAAFRKKETFATSGPRIKVRFFGGYDLENHSLSDENLIRKAYSFNTPMGGDIYADKQTSPTFLIWAVSDPLGGRLQRSQIIKGWVENGVHNEKVFDVACSDGLKVDPITQRCPDNGADVNINDCSTTPNVGASELKTFWKDPEFNSNMNAFYYVRVLENPSCRWSTWDAVRNGEKPRSDIEVTIQERAWSSPIWVKIN